VIDRATICLSAEMLGLISQAYETTVEYLKTRVQFDALSAIDEKRDDLAVAASATKARLTDCSRLITRSACT
jgi:alkylation response protein AidB-like acyl-CoA dehydrogenase